MMTFFSIVNKLTLLPAHFHKVSSSVCKSTKITSVQHVSKLRFSLGYFPTDKIKKLPNDVILYSLDKTSFLKYLSIFGMAQLFFCGYYASTFLTLRDTSSRSSEGVNKPWGLINLETYKSRMISAATCLGIGLLTAFISYSLPYRIVKQLILHKGGEIVSIVTYGPFGKTRTLAVPLRKISCVCTREQANAYIPFKIQNKLLYFLIDCKGKFHQPALFDISVGTKDFRF